ncbi:MAG: hypothetical protein M3198_18830 [Actinomycetota bacterium]|nr:hypothetical protein [Actinomycetota bacterium]
MQGVNVTEGAVASEATRRKLSRFGGDIEGVRIPIAAKRHLRKETDPPAHIQQAPPNGLPFQQR